MIKRPEILSQVRAALRRSRVVALIGPRQCGKTTLARELVDPASANYFDLEDPASLARLAEPMTALAPLKGVIVIDEIQRRPDLFPVLRVLADRRPGRWSASGCGAGSRVRTWPAPRRTACCGAGSSSRPSWNGIFP